MSDRDLQRYGIVAVIVLLLLAAGWLMLSRDDAPTRGGKLREVEQQTAVSTSVLSAEAEQTAKERLRGLQRLRTAAGELKDGTRWSYKQTTVEDDVQITDLDGQVHSSGEENMPTSGTLRLTFARKPKAGATQRALRTLLSDRQLQVVRVDRRTTIKSANLVALPVRSSGLKVTVDGLYLRESCEQVDQFPTAYTLQAACGRAPKNG